jgi:hypothetical protein
MILLENYKPFTKVFVSLIGDETSLQPIKILRDHYFKDLEKLDNPENDEAFTCSRRKLVSRLYDHAIF